MSSPLSILYLEDEPRDAELVQETLADEGIGCQITRVQTEGDFIASLERGTFDLILADYTLPSFDGLSALKIAQKNWPNLPFIFVSGTLGEEVAIEALKFGATDYVFKVRLSRIVPSVRRALREAAERVELRRSEAALRRSEAYLSEAQKLSHTGSFGWNVSSGEMYWSQETFRIFDYEPTVPMSIDRIVQRVHPEDRASVQQLIERVSSEREEWGFEHRLLMPDGSVKYLGVIGHPVLAESGKFEFLGAVTDITERKRSEEEMRKLASLVENSSDFIGMASLQGDVVFINPAGQHMVGLAVNEQVRGTKILSYIAEQDLERFENDVLPVVFKDGRWEGETLFKHFKTGASIAMWQHIFFVTEEGSGRRLAMSTLCRDITERKWSEEKLQQAQAQLTRMARLTTMGELAASIAHEVNQPLAAMVANGNACLRWLNRPEPDLEEARTAVERIVRDGSRAGEVISRVRALAKKTGTAKKSLDVNGMIQEVIALIQAEVRRNKVTLRTKLADGLPAVLGDRVQLQQVVLNLLLNGIEAMTTVGDRSRELVIRTQLGDEGHVRVAVRDSGVGIASENRDRIFDAFYTTKPDGMGMGLSISRSIVENHRGQLRAAANEGPGSTFEFTLAKYA